MTIFVRGLAPVIVAGLLIQTFWTPTVAYTGQRQVEPMTALWKEPVDLRSRDLFNGPWGSRDAPDPNAVYTFIRPKRGGANPGVVVRDPQGRTWRVKQARHRDHGDEPPVEVTLSRILSAVGYHQPPVYYLPSFRMTNGSETRVEPAGRFRLDDPSLEDLGSWKWEANPFVGTRPLQGLLVILVVFNSFDMKDSNNTIYEVRQGARAERWYVVRDLGGALGEIGRFFGSTRNDIDKFERVTLFRGVRGGLVEFDYGGKKKGLIKDRITVADAHWALGLLGGLSDRQWDDAFRAGGYERDLRARFIRKIQTTIAEGQRFTAGRNP
jgi:hypothetical protein